jgi:hypothetical protein
VSAPATTNDYFSLHEAVRTVKNQADQAAREAAKKEREGTEQRLIGELRKRYGGRTLFCYDESHENRFMGNPAREWNAVSLTYEACVTAARKHIFRYHGEDRWHRIQNELEGYTSQGQYPSLDPEDHLVFQAGSHWYCFFCVRGDDYCDKVAEYLASERKEDQRRSSSPEGIDVDFY